MDLVKLTMEGWILSNYSDLKMVVKSKGNGTLKISGKSRRGEQKLDGD